MCACMADLRLHATCDNFLTTYLDGVEQNDPNRARYNVFTEFTVPQHTQVIALQCYDSGGGYYLVASLNNGRKTDTDSWKCSNASEPGWTLPDFDDSHWPKAKGKW